MQYHLRGGEGDAHNDLRMNRDNRLLTVSITALALLPGGCRMRYHDLEGDAVHEQYFPTSKQCTGVK